MGVRFSKVVLAAALLAVGLAAASPFLCRRLVGTGEAFNYSLSVADAVVQMRHGIVPPLVGQTPYAFNGRIHPLRNAPYLYYLAGGIDALTLHRLQFWELQNASLALSLVAAVFTCYAGLRWATGCPRPLAFLLAAAYGLSPALLCVAHSLNLLMTVHAAVYVPLAIAACVRGCLRPSLRTDLWMAAALAMAWLAHPPVALWVTWGVILVRVVSFLVAPGWRPLARAAAAAALGVVLAGFVLASVADVNTDLDFFAPGVDSWRGFADVIVSNLRASLPGCLLPVSRIGNSYTDLQFGYVGWLLLALTLALLVVRRRGRPGWDRPALWAASGTSAVAVLLLLLTFPVPGFTHWAWVHMPIPVLQLTYAWPTQRLYLVAVGFTVFGAALALPPRWRELGAPRWVAPALAALGLAWTVYEAKPLVSIGFVNRHSIEETRSAYRPSNLNLTGTSYAFFGAPPDFINGADDPLFEYRLLMGGGGELTSNYARALRDAPVVQRGSLFADATAHATAVGKQTVVLLPGHRYLIAFDFKTAPFTGWVEFTGASIGRSYALPEAGADLGFGMKGSERRALSVWTDSDKPELVGVAIGMTDATAFAGRRVDLADFTLQDVKTDELPVRLDGYLPLRLRVDAPQSGCTVETPQRYLKGYEATVDGQPAPVLMSPWRNVMVGVPPGKSTVEIRYVGSPLVRAAFWACALGWAGFIAWVLAGSRLPERTRARTAAGFLALAWRRRFPLAAAAALALAVAATARHASRTGAARRDYLQAVGPLEVRFMLPYGRSGEIQPLVATGRPTAGVVISAALMDESHIRLSADVWGSVYSSVPIELDYSKVHTLVVSDSALFPPEHPALKDLSSVEVERLRRELRVELDGAVEIDASSYAYEAAPGEVYVGRTPFGSTSLPRFSGTIVDARRLPVPRMVGMPFGGRAHLRLQFPSDRVGSTESLLTFNSGTGTIVYSVTYLGSDRLRFTSSGADGVVRQSADVKVDLTKTHAINFWPSKPSDPTASFDISCELDGRQILGGTTPLVLAVYPLLSTGAIFSKPKSPLTRFSGRELSLTLTSDGTSTGSIEQFGPAHMILSLPSQKAGRHEPLLTTGKNGAGDLIFIIYEDEQHVRIGFDHWGHKATLSDPIAVDYAQPHDIWVTEGSLYPPAEDNAAWGTMDPTARALLKSKVAVVLDGKVVLSQENPTYPSTKAQVAFAKNGIGGSTADPVFSGIVHYSERTGSLQPPGMKL